MRSAFNELSPLSNENDSSLISRPNIITPFEKCLNKYEGSERAQSNDTEKKNEAIINSDNENETSLQFTSSSNEVTSNALKHCSLNNANSINSYIRNKNDFHSFQTVLLVIAWGQILISWGSQYDHKGTHVRPGQYARNLTPSHYNDFRRTGTTKHFQWICRPMNYYLQ